MAEDPVDLRRAARELWGEILTVLEDAHLSCRGEVKLPLSGPLFPRPADNLVEPFISGEDLVVDVSVVDVLHLTLLLQAPLRASRLRLVRGQAGSTRGGMPGGGLTAPTGGGQVYGGVVAPFAEVRRPGVPSAGANAASPPCRRPPRRAEGASW